MGITKIIAANLSAWMEVHPTLNTLKAVSNRAKVGFGTVQRAKNGTGNNTVESLEAIAKAFNKELIDLLLPNDVIYLVEGHGNNSVQLNEKSAAILNFHQPENEHPDIIAAVDLMRRMNDSGKASALKHVRIIADENIAIKANREQ